MAEKKDVISTIVEKILEDIRLSETGITIPEIILKDKVAEYQHLILKEVKDRLQREDIVITRGERNGKS